MKKDYTHITMIIDRSGSMSFGWNDVLGGYKAIVEEQKKQPGKCTFTTAVFDTQHDILEDFKDIQEVSEILNASPRGGTALLDAIGFTVKSVGEKLAALPEDERPEKVIVQVQSDGNENASREYTKEQIKELIEEQENKYNWQFLFIGASLESVNEAQSLGIKSANTAVYSTSNYNGTLDTLNMKFSTMRSCSVDAFASAAAYSDEEKSAMK